mmetsp:Transcript_3704/g.4015  ORF Transcript_3704/g.4015 Transcript_3704/m.4015 type:complete len:241 (+) Transcript_3704:249-971(+)
MYTNSKNNFSRFSSSTTNDVSWQSVLNFSQITPRVRQHLTRVYTCLTLMIAVAAVGCYVQILTHISYIFSAIMLFASLFGTMWASSESTRMACLAAFGFFKGLTVGGLVEYSLSVNAGIVLAAFLTTTVIFACFSLASLFAPKRSLLYIGGFLGSAVMILAILGLANLFLRMEFLFNLSLYGGLLIFCGYVIYDTQLIVAKAEAGNFDYIRHTLDLFIDFAAIFVRILIILTKKEEKKRD